MAEAFYLGAAQKRPETRQFKVLEKKKIKKEINKKDSYHQREQQ